jgi:hypothetical protein
MEKSVLTGELVVSEGNVVMSSARISDFFLLGFENSRLYSWRMTIHQANFPLICCRLRKYCMGFESSTTLVVQSKI